MVLLREGVVAVDAGSSIVCGERRGTSSMSREDGASESLVKFGEEHTERCVGN